MLNAYTDSSVDLTGDAGKAQTQKIATALMLIPGVGTAIGGALLAITSAVGFAHAGAGLCATSPPAGSGWGDLKRWAHYTPWANSAANLASGAAWYEGKDAAGSFEDVANRALAYQRALYDNCFSNIAAPPPLVLAQLVAAWNATHAGPTRTITRAIPNLNALGSTAPGFDPLADALSGNDTSGKVAAIKVNAGAPIKKVAVLKLSPHPGAVSAAAPTAGAASSGSSSTVALLAVAAAAGAAAFYVRAQRRKRAPLVPKSLTRLVGR